MPTLGQYSLTLEDWRKRLNPQGLTDVVIETMNQTNPILKDMKWAEGNLPTGNMTTQRTELPKIYTRALNRGVQNSKSRTKQVTDTCTIYEAHSKVDTKLLKMMNDPQAFRASEDLAFVESFNQKLAGDLFYGDSDTNPDQFNGFNVRFNKLSGNKGDAGYQIISAGGTGATNTSIWFVCWGDNSVHGIFPKGSQAGLAVEQKGEQLVTDADGLEYYAHLTKFEWNPGLAVRNHRFVSRLANIDASTLFKLTSDQKRSIVENAILAKNRIQNLDARVTPAWYVSDNMYSFFETYLIDKNNVHVTRQELAGKCPELYFAGYPIRKCDAILETESAIS